MAVNRVVTKQLAGLEDILTGVGTVVQARASGNVNITKINASNLSYDISNSIKEKIANKLEVLSSVLEMKAITTTALEDLVIYLSGYNNFGDGGGGLFWFDSSDTSSTEDLSLIFNPDNPANGRWKRVDTSHQISADNGDTDLVLSAFEAGIQLFATNLTADRTVTLPASGLFKGQRFRFTRTDSSKFKLTIGGIVTLRAEGSIEVIYNGLIWIRTSSTGKVRHWSYSIGSFSTPTGIGLSDLIVDPITNNLISCANVTNLIYIHDGINEIVSSSFAAPGSDITGVTIDHSTGNLISCSDLSNLIYIHAGITVTISSSFASPGGSISGVAIDKNTGNLISCDFGANLIYIHDGITSTILSSFASPSSDITGLEIDPYTGNLISCDVIANRFYVHEGITSTILNTFITPGTDINGIAIDHSTGNLISCDDSDSLFYIHPTQIMY